MKSMPANLIDSVVANGFCSGCAACAGIAGENTVKMSISRQGYLRPVFLNQLSPQQSEKINNVCPGIRIERASTEVPYHAIWGALSSVRTAHSTDAEIRRVGSSGGVISALALFLLETRKVDFVAQIAVSIDDPLVNRIQQSRTRDDVLRAAGSRYAPAAPLEMIEEFLNSGERFAFIGKPCDVAALRALARVDNRVNRQVPFMISFMCAGVPSFHGTHALLERMGVATEDLSQFRYRGDGWPGNARAVTRDGRVEEMDYNSSWGNVLNRHLQFRCKICPDGTGELADIVCADAWYGKDGYPDFDERDGRSLLLARTATGEKLVSDAMSARVIDGSDLAVVDIASMQPYQLNRKQMVLARLIGTWLRRGSVPRYLNFGLVRASWSAAKSSWFRNAIGTFKRANGEE
jgi:coenzyme F420 hydrogenase subunit beta